MNTKQTILSLAIFIASFLGFSDKIQADNTTASVYYNVWYDQAEQMLVFNCRWDNNESLIEPEVQWGTDPNAYAYGWKFGKIYGAQGEVNHKVKANPCTMYYTQLLFKDWTTGNNYTISQNRNTPGDLPPSFNSVQASNIGYYNAVLNLNLDTKCNEAKLKVSISKKGGTPVPVDLSNPYVFGTKSIKLPIYGLDPNEWYEVQLEAETFVGQTSYTHGFITMSNLLPFTESLRATTNGNPYSATLYGDVDPKNTNSTQWRVEFGTDIHMDELSPWFNVYQKGSNSFDIHYLKPNTQYFWRSVVQNEFGRFDGQVKTFKTDALAGITDLNLKSNDKLQVSSRSGGITIFTEQDAKVNVLNIQGQLIGIYDVAGIMHINDLPAGTYVIKTTIEGQAMAKKTIVF